MSYFCISLSLKENTIAMKLLNNPHLLKKYINLYNIDLFFSQDLTEHMSLYKVKKGEHLLSTSEEVTHFFFLVSGGVKIVLNLENGNTLLITYSTPLEMLGEMEILDNPYSKYDVIATEDSIVIAIPRKTFSKLIENDPVFWKRLYSSTLNKLQSTINTKIISSAYSLEHVLANYLITHTTEKDDIILVENVNFSELAQLLGTSYRHLNRIFKKFIELKILKKDGKNIVILDYDKLSDYYIELY
jgi:CRP-like cAMP-binding protein